jgi:hypothetical protein
MKHELTPKSFQVFSFMVVRRQNQTNKQTSPKLESKCVAQKI